MLELEIDGKALEVEDGTTVIEAAQAAGIAIPHFCYHKKLSIAASCRMCLVEVEKAPKPMPACATVVTKGMKVFTHSALAVKAQKDVMEFLLINHPLDCPICDQGGECQLQDLSVGYGGSAGRYQEEKRVVVNKNLGALISTDMTRCINCTRCVRFMQEIAGNMELGQAWRGDRAEIMPFLGRTIESEISGNIIDLCPVGALTSKPFRFAARNWELARRPSISPHDGLGSHLHVQTLHNKVMRVLPRENEAINECWLSDKDRFSYQALALDGPNGRLTAPMVKQGGEWKTVSWNAALDYASHALRDTARNHGAAQIGGLLSPHATLEELYLAGKLLRGIGSDNLDFRLRQCDFSQDGQRKGAPWLGMPVAGIGNLKRILVVGSFLRKDHPLIAQRLRQAVRRGAQVSLLHSTDDPEHLAFHARAIVTPSRLPQQLAAVLKAVAALKQMTLPGDAANIAAAVDVDPIAQRIAESLVSETHEGSKTAIFLGNFAQHHPQAAILHSLAQQLAQHLGARFGFLGEAANSVGGYVARALPQGTGLDAARLIAEPRKTYLLLGCEPELDCADGKAALAAMQQAASVIALTAFKSPALLEYADCLLPVAPFTETSGTFINTEGRVQGFVAACKPQGDARPAWKVLRVLGNLLELAGFDQESSEAVRDEALAGQTEFVSGLDNAVASGVVTFPAQASGIERIADVPIHFADPLVRRAPPLQATADAAIPTARMNDRMLAKLGVEAGDSVEIGAHGAQGAVLPVQLDPGVPDGCVRIAAAHSATLGVGAMFGVIDVRKV